MVFGSSTILGMIKLVCLMEAITYGRRLFPISTEDPKPIRASHFIAKRNNKEIATLDFLNHLKHEKLIDARSPGEYDGKYRRALESGHIPGAINLEWKQALRRDGTLKDSGQLSKIFSRFNTEASYVTYCQSGYRAAHSWLALKLLGFENVRNYLGSWYEWGNRKAVSEKMRTRTNPGRSA